MRPEITVGDKMDRRFGTVAAERLLPAILGVQHGVGHVEGVGDGPFRQHSVSVNAPSPNFECNSCRAKSETIVVLNLFQ